MLLEDFCVILSLVETIMHFAAAVASLLYIRACDVCGYVLRAVSTRDQSREIGER